MTTPQDPQEYIHRVAADADGNRIGKVSQVYLDDDSGQPEWVLVETGLFGTRQSFAPIHGARVDGEVVVLAVSKDQVKDAPNIDRDAHISESEEDALRQYYRGYLGTGGAGQRLAGQRPGWPSNKAAICTGRSFPGAAWSRRGVSGPCPRCRHFLDDRQTLSGLPGLIGVGGPRGDEVSRGEAAAHWTGRYAQVDVSCGCGDTHDGAPEGRTGCGVSFRVELPVQEVSHPGQ